MGSNRLGAFPGTRWVAAWLLLPGLGLIAAALIWYEERLYRLLHLPSILATMKDAQRSSFTPRYFANKIGWPEAIRHAWYGDFPNRLPTFWPNWEILATVLALLCVFTYIRRSPRPLRAGIFGGFLLGVILVSAAVIQGLLSASGFKVAEDLSLMRGSMQEVTLPWVYWLAFTFQVIILAILFASAMRLQLTRDGSHFRNIPSDSSEPSAKNRCVAQNLHPSAFGTLSYLRLPMGTINQWTPRIFYAHEHAMPVENIGPGLLDYVDNVIYVLTEKSMKDVTLWRCSAENAERPILLVDRRIGFGRHIWCLLDFNRPGGGDDLNIRFHTLYPRHLDVWDWSLLRYLLFPVALAMEISGGSRGRNPDEELKPGQKFIAFVGFGIVFAITLWTTQWMGAFAHHPLRWWLLILGSLGFSSLIELVFTANTPRPDMERYSAELLTVVQQSVHLATISMQKVS